MEPVEPVEPLEPFSLEVAGNSAELLLQSLPSCIAQWLSSMAGFLPGMFSVSSYLAQVRPEQAASCGRSSLLLAGWW